MIRIGLPAPTLMRLRLRAQITANRVARRAETIRQGVLTTLHNDLAALQRIPQALLWRPAAKTPTAADPYTLMQEFEDHFQGLVDLLCWSAKDGIHDRRDARYAELRDWFIRNYDAIRPALLFHLQGEPEDLLLTEEGGPAPRDAFESLFLPRNVDAIINSETVICRIMRTRCALDSYREQINAARR
jgi:hypothetical protein